MSTNRTPHENRTTIRLDDSSHDPASLFLAALGHRDFDELQSLLAPDVWLRALLPRKLVEANTSAAAAEAFRSWYEGAEAFSVLEADHQTVGNRHSIRYRFLLRPDWDPEQWHVIEQTGYCRVKGDRISRIDIACTGFFPTDGPSAAGTEPVH